MANRTTKKPYARADTFSRRRTDQSEWIVNGGGVDMPWVEKGKLKNMVAMFNDMQDKTDKKLKFNPFSDDYEKPEHKKSDNRYGRPTEGSLTEMRGVRAGNDVSKEILEVCEVIHDCGTEMDDGTRVMTFGRIFNLYTKISDKVVGMLLRARRHGLIEFEGEMLFQRRDDDVPIKLTKPLAEIRACFKQSGDPVRCVALNKSEN